MDEMPVLEGWARYAVFWVPPPGSPLAQAGAEWLGWDSATGRARARHGTDPRVERPWRYGLHATLKAPFRLAEGRSAADLDAAVAALAARLAPAEGPGLELGDGLGFFALTPSGENAAVDAVAAACVRDLDAFRAPLTAAERAKRNPERLDPLRRAMLDAWGYPHVLDAFRFHVTLTGPVRELDADATRTELERRFAPLAEPRFRLDALALLGDPGTGGFRLLRRHALTGSR